MRLLLPWDGVIADDDFFGGTHRLLTYMNAIGALNVVHCYITDIDAMKASITPRTKMIFLESPTNPLIKVFDVKAICDHAHAVNPELLLVFDTTMMTPLFMTPLDLGVDIHY